MKRIVILTGSELRHTFFRKHVALNPGIEVVNTYCEGLQKSLRAVVEHDDNSNDIRLRHLAARERSEEDFFRLYVDATEDRSNPVFLPKGDINLPEHQSAIIAARPDLIVAYGCSIVREPLLSAFEGRFLNVHLGLSPYYRGSGTNFWPLVNGEPEFVGATFMYIDAGVDTGEVIHQIRARYEWGDTPSQIGNRLIADMTAVYVRLILNCDLLERMPQLTVPEYERYYRKKDYTEESVEALYRAFGSGLIERYVAEQKSRCAMAPMVINPALSGSIS